MSHRTGAATAGAGYDQLNPRPAPSTWAAATWIATLGFTPAAGNSFTIIKSSTPISGTFNGLAEGGTVKIGGVPFTITYKGGASGDDVVLTPSVATTTPTGTTTSLESSANPSTLDQTVAFTAIVAPASGNSSPTGNVTFTIDGQAQTPVALAVVSGVDQATFTTSTLTNGPHTISVAYAGNASFAPSAPSSPLTQTVDAPTTIMLSSSSNPSLLGQSVTFTATVTVSMCEPCRQPGELQRGWDLPVYQPPRFRGQGDVYHVCNGNRVGFDRGELHADGRLSGQSAPDGDADSERRASGNHGDPAHVLGQSFDVGPVCHFHGGCDYDGIRHAGGSRDIHDRRQGVNSRGLTVASGVDEATLSTAGIVGRPTRRQCGVRALGEFRWEPVQQFDTGCERRAAGIDRNQAELLGQPRDGWPGRHLHGRSHQCGRRHARG